MELQEDVPHIRAICRNDTYWVLPPESAASFLADWKAGRPFWTGIGQFGDTTHIKLADITGVIERSASGLARDREEAAERKRREKSADVLGDA